MSLLVDRKALDIPEGKHAILITDSNGHTPTYFDPSVDDEVKAAMATFEESMAKGMAAYALDGADPNVVTRTFDPTAEVTVVIPQTVGG